MEEISSSVEARRHLVEALRADLIGPYQAGAPEVLETPPSRWYLAGFLVPEAAQPEDDPTEDEDAAAGPDSTDDPEDDPAIKKPRWLPSSAGMTVLLPRARDGERALVDVAWASYVKDPDDKASEEGAPAPGRARKRRARWTRHPHAVTGIELPLDRERLEAGTEVSGSDGLWLKGTVGGTTAPGLDDGTRALSVFLVNQREPAPRGRSDEAYAFQVELTVRFPSGLVARPNRVGERANDPDDQIADLQFRTHHEYAVGHNASVEVDVGAGIPKDAPVTTARLAWIPEVEVKRVKTRDATKTTTSMEALAALAAEDGDALARALQPLVAEYTAWVREQRKVAIDGDHRAGVAADLLATADVAAGRIEEGIRLLATDAVARRAFGLANDAMARAARARKPERYVEQQPAWRLFQLGFILLSLPSLARHDHPDRSLVELIYFPTGGGKTEAYLGLAAFTMILRRLRGAGSPDGGLGVAVLLRYTLRLLTLDQLGRAATLVCALERIRAKQPDLGDVRFSLGLWVGRSATKNTLEQVVFDITEYKNSTSPTALSPCPITKCPWCGSPLGKDGLNPVPNKTKPEAIVVACTSLGCDFSAARNRDGLPVVFIDEQLYRELPSFVIGTVDKFAMLPWRGETGALFGKVGARRGGSFAGFVDGPPRGTGWTPLPDGLPPPELIIQDELHLISGPLGTMVGLYETAIEELSRRPGKRLPKLVASTATVKRAREQIQALYGRKLAMFPPPGIDDGESFFAEVDGQHPGRLYVGVAAPGRSVKGILLRVYAALLGAAQWALEHQAPGSAAADPYLTLVGYFNSLRELGGTRRLIEDVARAQAATAAQRRPAGTGANRWLAARKLASDVEELTSREKTPAITKIKERLEKHVGQDGFIDVVLASNMISVGVDIERLGLMVVAGQPKSTSEYIQSSSRVGRDYKRPGLVVTVLNVNRPRDRSHYEHFIAYHQCFYRFVEATSVTPFSGPALDRGLAGVLVALTRHGAPDMTPPAAAIRLPERRAIAEQAAAALAARARSQPGLRTEAAAAAKSAKVAARAKHVIDEWSAIATAASERGERSYSPYDRDRVGTTLLRTALDEDDDDKLVAPTSMRDVEPTVHLWVRKPGQPGGQR